MTQIMKSCFITLTILFLWGVEEGAEAVQICHCPFMLPPLQTLCKSDVVIRAHVTGKEEVDSGTTKMIKYDIYPITVYKGSLRGNAIFSPMGCTANLQTDGAEYIITGSLAANGKVQITSCNFFKLWADLNAAELSLLQNYPNSCKH